MGFAQEVKDFLGAMQAGEKINASRTDREYKSALTDSTTKKTERDNDPETLQLATDKARADLDRTRAAIKATGANIGLTNERIQNARMQRQLLKDSLNPSSGLLPTATAPTAGANAGAGAIPMQSTIDVEPHYADGGLVEPEPDEDDATMGAAPAAALPTETPAQSPTDVSARSRRDASIGGVISPALVADAAKAGLTFGVNAFGLGGRSGVPSARSAAAARQYLAGTGGLTDAEMDAVKKSVDPQGKLTEAQRNVAALGSVYQYQLNKGNPEGAQRVAFQMLQHYRALSTRYAAIAAHAAENGDLDTAAQAAVKSYANIPDGRDLEVHRNPDNPNQLVYSYTDATTGETIAKGLVTPQQLVASAMGMAQGGFDKAILMAAGAREDPKAKKGGGMKVSDRKSLAAMADEAVSKFETDYATKAEKDKKMQPLAADYTGNLRDATQHIMTQNPGATAREAFQAAQQLYTPSKTDVSKTGFKVEKSEDDGLNTIKFDNGRTIKLDDNTLEPILMARAATIKAQQKSELEKAAAEKRGGVGTKAAALGGAIGDGLSSMWEAIKERDPQRRTQQAIPTPDVEAMPQ